MRAPDVGTIINPVPDAGAVRQLPHSRPRRRAVRVVAGICWLYLVTLVALGLLLAFAADRWWLATVAMYGPRWVWSVPLALLLPAAVMLPRRGTWVALGLSLIVLLGPVMHLCVPWRRVLSGGGGSSRPLRVLTLNADNNDVNAHALKRWIEQVRPDVVALQAWPAGYQQRVFGDAGWHVRADGQFLLASRYPIEPLGLVPAPASVTHTSPPAAAFEVETPGGPIRLFNVHTATPRFALLGVWYHGWNGADELRANSAERRAQSEAIRRAVDSSDARSRRVLVLGDFNTPPDGAAYRRSWSDFSNGFTACGFGFGNTHFTRHTAVRIDHVLAGPGWRFRRCWVGPAVGSAHRPVVADVEPTGSAD